MDPDKLEKYSSAITLSDMEVFVFPELMYSLLLANIMSPIIWKWRQEDCFRRLAKKDPYKKLMRLKQYIMDGYEFNLDLNTWGLTRQDRELARFARFISPEDIARSNALFGYHGDKYYFDVDIRKHFGLDKYDGDVIPYWKTETVEAMTAFHRKNGYRTGAGECVSLSTLYAAAAFIVCGIPLEDIYLVLTPLHSQNFIDLADGVLTNNRRIVTKAMWFNGTALSDKAQRALRNEQVTVVAHPTGYVHCLYEEATIRPAVYEKFKERLNRYLTAELTSLTLANFLRANPRYQRYFQFCQQRRGENMFIWAEVLFHYEHGSNYRIGDHTFDKLLDEVLSEDYSLHKAPNRLCCEELMAFIKYENLDLMKSDDRLRIANYIKPFMPDAEAFVEDLYSFHHLEPRLPGGEKRFVEAPAIELSVGQSRHEIIDTLQSVRNVNPVADLAFYAFRDMDTCDWQPFIIAALERSPVSIEAAKGQTIEEVYEGLRRMDGESIYDGNRLAQPDEVANFNTGDGVEKAFYLANVLRSRMPDLPMELEIDMHDVVLKADRDYRFDSAKHFRKSLVLSPILSSEAPHE
ncbi:MAG TPA: hypothetical protein P5279_00715 [Anaerohalosphaeraceae bacterium]|nr:hypothetical protein [Anaerohalosphaeraceae bacterium]HRT48987.1 hypothetical protein [Anaerohalosphaeraceae bacterium]HRT85110.1 hypothetical protein [Anaerohalosphaeraceae bacterium]